ncbi:hypothetical protein EYZ11_001135 [Aspergillus tanneri]|uniref:Phenazine biosynthesis protein n=1 Tax=Aspergillus tanneri TaxID=1220188 RepID=A0A4S3JVG1_9EURO|nr:uncharacterized protein ATNIH1004_004451 [Aspergillus tanneri]KAA8648566.1 hypothetical protein ATNIH1004_004451 [Aspergillus tanneri]THC99411.1 hypothetical protein EYZ11_001135 [Aspergillus tanneri]
MADRSLQYVTLDVFTSTKLQGNPVAVVLLTGDVELPESKKLQITREFNISETVFLHPAVHGQPPRIQIFTLSGELNFAGHPTIGAAHYLFQKELLTGPLPSPSPPSLTLGDDNSLDIDTKAGPVRVQFHPAENTVSADIPFNLHVHSGCVRKDALLATQPRIAGGGDNNPDTDLSKGMRSDYPLVSIVRGVTFALVDLSEDLMAAVAAGASPAVELDRDWAPSFISTMYYRRMVMRGQEETEEGTVERLHVRTIAIGFEDPACGSGACALAAYLALQRGGKGKKYRYQIDQGMEIGRRSRIVVDVVLDREGTGVAKVIMTGEATVVMEGRLRY